MNNSLLATTLPLCKVKLRLLVNSLKARVTGKKAALVFLGAISVIFAIAIAVSDLVSFMNFTEPQTRLTEWLIGILAFYAIFVVFVSDLLSGHTINAGQMSSDFDYLSTLPVPPTSLLCVKIFERFASDYIGAMILVTGFVATTCRNGINPVGIMISLLLFSQISILTGTIINLIMLTLRRHLPLTSINNFFSFFGYAVGFAIFIPYAIVDQMPYKAIEFFVSSHSHFQDSLFVIFQPVRWLGTILVKAEPVTELWQFSGAWLIAMLLCTIPLHRALNSGVLSIKRTKTNRKNSRQTSRFSGLVQKDFLLLQSDYNIRINALLLPVTLIAINVFFVDHLLAFKTPGSLMNMIFAGIIYFSMFGPTNAIGSEGRTISLLESLPLHPQKILWRKFVFWFTTSVLIFMPLTILAGWYMGFDSAVTAKAMLLALGFTAACIWVSLQLSAIFPIFDSKMLQQSSSLTAKAAAFGVMLLLVPVKGISALNFYTLLIFALVALLLNMKARALMFYRLEIEQHNNKQQQWLNLMLLIFGFLGFESLINQIFQAIIPGEDTGLWSWVLPALAALPMLILSTVFRKPWTKESSLPDNKTQSYLSKALTVSAFSALSACLTWLYLLYNPATKKLLTNELLHFASLINSLGLSFELSLLLVATIPIAFTTLLTMIAAIHAKSDFITGQYGRIFVTLVAMAAVAPVSAMIPAFITTAFIALHCRFFASPSGAALIAAASTALPIFLLFR